MKCPIKKNVGIARCRECLTKPYFMRHVAKFEQCPEGYTAQQPPLGLGDIVEKLAKPFAKAVGAKCLEKDGTLKPKSRCAENRDALNKFAL